VSLVCDPSTTLSAPASSLRLPIYSTTSAPASPTLSSFPEPHSTLHSFSRANAQHPTIVSSKNTNTWSAGLEECTKPRCTFSTTVNDHSRAPCPISLQNATIFQANSSLLQHDLGMGLYWCSTDIPRPDSRYTIPQQRGGWEIICSCLLTWMFFSWIAVCLNVPLAAASSQKRLKRKLLWLVISLVAPEFVIILKVHFVGLD
jgi:hypothetical protein